MQAPETDQRWKKHAACRGVDVHSFFPERGGSVAEVKAICAICVVRQCCLEYAIENHERWGIWGGVSERQRRRMRTGRIPIAS